jgi:hypothetical protein
MTPVLSGGLIYEYTQEPSNYGIVEINADGTIRLLPDFDALQRQFNTLNVTALQGLKAQNATNDPPDCVPSLIKTAKFSNNFTIPVQLPEIKALIDNGIQNAPRGKLVPVTKTTVDQQVKASNGDVISGLSIRILANDESNNPNGATMPTSTATTSAPSKPTESKPNAAVSVSASFGPLAGAAALAGWTLLF